MGEWWYKELMHIFIKISFIFTLIFLLGCKEKEYVKDFKVEGIAVGDSLLTYFSEEDILKNQRTKDIFGKPDDLTSLYVDSTFEDYEFETYQKIQIYYLRDDKKYIIHSVGGAIFYQTDYKACNDKFFEVKKKGSYSLEEIDEKIDNKIKKIIGNEIDISNKGIYETALLWGSLDIYLSDKTFSKIEQKEFINRFGEKANKAISLLKMSNSKDMLEKKIDMSFSEASKLLKTDKNRLIEELKTVGKETGGEKMKKLKIIGKLLNFLGVKKPVSF